MSNGNGSFHCVVWCVHVVMRAAKSQWRKTIFFYFSKKKRYAKHVHANCRTFRDREHTATASVLDSCACPQADRAQSRMVCDALLMALAALRGLLEGLPAVLLHQDHARVAWSPRDERAPRVVAVDIFVVGDALALEAHEPDGPPPPEGGTYVFRATRSVLNKRGQEQHPTGQVARAAETAD